jgi:hypothetical protein
MGRSGPEPCQCSYRDVCVVAVKAFQITQSADYFTQFSSCCIGCNDRNLCHGFGTDGHAVHVGKGCILLL